jgi:hypothetical protein
MSNLYLVGFGILTLSAIAFGLGQGGIMLFCGGC